MASKSYRNITIGGEENQVHMGDTHYHGKSLLARWHWMFVSLNMSLDRRE